MTKDQLAQALRDALMNASSGNVSLDTNANTIMIGGPINLDRLAEFFTQAYWKPKAELDQLEVNGLFIIANKVDGDGQAVTLAMIDEDGVFDAIEGTRFSADAFTHAATIIDLP